MLTHRIYYRRLIAGSLLILGLFFLWFLYKAPDLANAVTAIFLGIWLGVSRPAILLFIIASFCMMGYGLFVRRRYALMLFWCGFALFFLASLMGLGARYY